MEPRQPMEPRRRAVSPTQFKYWELCLVKNPLPLVFVSPNSLAVARRLAGALPPRRRARLSIPPRRLHVEVLFGFVELGFRCDMQFYGRFRSSVLVAYFLCCSTRSSSSSP
ncbi:hypothetical protein ACP4OV_026728 [Aristida adscensionis]